MWGELASSLKHADGYVIAIIVLGFLASVIFFERLIMIQFVYHIDFKKFLSNLKKIVKADDMDRAITLCKNVSHTSLPYISLRALEAAETDPTRVRGTIEEEAMDFLPKLETRLSALPAIATLVLLIGILGTIDALWSAFHSIDVLDTAKKQGTLAQGVSTSLNSTAVALIFGIILLAGYTILKGMAAHLTERVHHGVAVLTNLLAPQESLSYMAVASAQQVAEHPAPPAAAQDPQTGKQGTPAPQADESFDDVSIEDIKDEEEII
jgi:biopolymer transport protein ExbB/TolQ